ncbi:MAG: hypothetical protein ABW146_04310 [Candidatus Sedimenticola sp. 6PFRAG7]
MDALTNKKQMEETVITDLDDGMTFAQDVVDSQGRILIAKGTPVQQKHIRILKSWGIERVRIIPPGPSTKTQTVGNGSQSEFQRELQQMLDRRFMLTNREHPAIQAVYDICLEHALKRLGSKRNGSK